MRETDDILTLNQRKQNPKSVNRDNSKLIHPPHWTAKPPRRSHSFLWWREWARTRAERGGTKREDESLSSTMKQGGRGANFKYEEREKKAKKVFIT